MPFLVRERLFMGKISDAAEVLQKDGGEITHVLSLLSSTSISFFSDWKPSVSIPTQEIRKVIVGDSGSSSDSDEAERSPKRPMAPGSVLYSLERAGPGLKLVRMAVPLRDMEDVDLLDYLDVCLNFIDESRKEGSILVHCFAGVSRSASIITAYLMKTEQKSLEDALDSLRQICEYICPNEGFLDQLKMFEYMGFKVDPVSPIYKRFRLKLLGDSYSRGDKMHSSIFGADPGVQPEISSKVSAKQNEPTGAYRCKKCRRVVALQENVVRHIPGEGEACFVWRKRSTNPSSFEAAGESRCSSLFVEPLRWMMPTVEGGVLLGKLSCVRCGTRLGSFNWSGIRCNCGSWITPAFQIHKSRVDDSTTTTAL